MNAILTTTVSILAICGLAWTARMMLRLPICPICAGVAGTWLWMVIARALGHAVDVTMLSILLGASVAGIAYQIAKQLPQGRSSLLWKTLFVPAGLVAAYALAAAQWTLLAVAGGALVLLTAFFLRPPSVSDESETVEALKEKMRECC